MGQTLIKLFLTRRLAALASIESLRAIREGLLWILPCLLVSAGFLILSECVRMLGFSPQAVSFLAGLHDRISSVIPLLVAASIGYMLAIQHRLPQLPIAFLCLTQVVLATFLLREYPRASATFLLFIAIASPLINVPAVAWLHRFRWTRLVHEDLIGHNLKGTINMVLPGAITALALVVVLSMLLQIPYVAQLQGPQVLDALQAPYGSGLFVTLMNSLLWFFGIHGVYALQPLFDVLDQAVTLNGAALAAGEPVPYLLNSGLLGSFAFIGGSGSALCLLLAILLCSRSRSMRLLAMASLPLSLFNVSEVLLFGLPIILNPRLFIPFLLVPALNAMAALAVVQVGWVSPAVASVPFTAPVLLNAYLSTHGDMAAVALQVVLVGLGTLVYAPYVRAIHRQPSEGGTVYLKSLDMTFRGLEEKGRLLEFDPILASHRTLARQAVELSRIQQISDYEFYLEFQPQVSTRTGLCTGCEALMRARDSQGTVHSPWEFLQWLAQARLMPDVDVWVASQAVRQYQKWKKAGFELPITINVSSFTLKDAAFGDRLVEILAQAHGWVSVEITEDALVSDIQATRQTIQKLQALGAKVYIDDFGTGFSALSYLHQFPVDFIKIDRSFVVAQHDPKGAQVLTGMLRFCEALSLGVVVEGVETAEQLAFLNTGAELFIQGWYFSRALPGDEMPQFVRERAALA
ncbi:PTS sugar transporter subunit IIC/EAL domain-containing protein [Pseudomonas fluorescens]|uniref:EAL domain-containing protein n=1 Tax=Pseudomonas fluorescens group TaxID=136843 RepID=UPI00177B2CB9|nr:MULTISPECIES: EAL domain-containing protein [Pseudomonas fluorescens group]MBD8149968.1 PTS sugar transporter subunit IIC/EAL domain-containing protein [Pseudomonas fluorescens]MBD8179300.1 PTS sugar transporter subunit IIC/EAL domain-containing protein [Pseudomonas fluorescens]MBD8746451.1 PTS sugar transporter subunit IIC/EAL domain-containing protein [Pseudomonas fluorescens]MBD8749784.1 PTS sugar transporter subunit IIC/EAL domain-containing protein [Pseudomonas fluorescens]MBD8758709.1